MLAFPKNRLQRRFTVMLAAAVVVVFASLLQKCLFLSRIFKGRKYPYETSTRKNLESRRHHQLRPVIGFGHRQPTSNHFCIGPLVDVPPSKKKNRDKFTRVMRSCHFTDVCFNATGNLLYYAHNETTLLADEIETVMHGQDQWKGPNHFHPSIGGSDLNKDRWLRPIIVHSSRPKHCKWVQQVAIPYIPQHISNFGHDLLDNVMSFYRLLKLFDFYSHDIEFVPLRMFGMDSKREIDTRILSKVLDPFVGLTNSAETAFFPNYFAAHANDCLCFENVISGKYFHTDHGMDESWHGRLDLFNPFYVGKGDLLRDFRDAYMIRARMDPFMRPNNTVLVITRSTGYNPRDHRIWNHTRVASHVTSSLRQAGKPDQIQIINAEELNMVEQIKMTASSKVMVVMKGGASLLSLFLPRGATSILLHRGKGNFDSAVYDNVPYFHVWSEPVLSNVTVANNMTENVYNLESISHQVLQGIERYDESAYY